MAERSEWTIRPRDGSPEERPVDRLVDGGGEVVTNYNDGGLTVVDAQVRENVGAANCCTIRSTSIHNSPEFSEKPVIVPEGSSVDFIDHEKWSSKREVGIVVSRDMELSIN